MHQSWMAENYSLVIVYLITEYYLVEMSVVFSSFARLSTGVGPVFNAVFPWFCMIKNRLRKPKTEPRLK